MAAQLDALGVVYNCLVRDRHLVRANQIPWRPYPGLGADMRVVPERCAKTPQKKTPPSVQWPRRRSKDRGIDESPSRAAQPIAQRKRRNQIRIGVSH